MRSLVHRFRFMLSKERRWVRKAIRTTWILFVCFLVGAPLYIYAVISNPLDLFGDMPSLVAIENPENDLSSEVISSDGVSLGRYFRFNRSQVSFDDLSPDLVHTLIYSEDHRFYEHAGMDFWAFFRVLKGLISFQKQG